MSKSKFLTELNQDLEVVECNAILKKFTYIALPKPLSEYEEDEYVQRLVRHLDTPTGERDSVYSYILSDPDLGPEGDFYHYLMMNCLENMGYMEHGTGIRAGYKQS